MTSIITHWNTYGPRGVPSGFVLVQNFVQGRRPCLKYIFQFSIFHSRIVYFSYLPVSRRSIEELIMAATRFPNALMQIRTFNARDAPLPVPNSFSKKDSCGNLLRIEDFLSRRS